MAVQGALTENRERVTGWLPAIVVIRGWLSSTVILAIAQLEDAFILSPITLCNWPAQWTRGACGKASTTIVRAKTI